MLTKLGGIYLKYGYVSWYPFRCFKLNSERKQSVYKGQTVFSQIMDFLPIKNFSDFGICDNIFINHALWA